MLEIGPLSFYGAGLVIGLYILSHLTQKVVAWLSRKEGPNERMLAFILIGGICGFLIGSVFQNYSNTYNECKGQEGSFIGCMSKAL